MVFLVTERRKAKKILKVFQPTTVRRNLKIDINLFSTNRNIFFIIGIGFGRINYV
jgi:hypothetical protein